MAKLYILCNARLSVTANFENISNSQNFPYRITNKFTCMP